MKKLFLTLGLASACLTSYAFERVLYRQNFETVTTPEAAGWSFGGESMSLASDFEGKYLELSLGQNNGRSGQVTWGDSIYLDREGELVLEDKCYKMTFNFCINKMPNNQFNSEITVFTNHAPIANNLYRLPWSDTDKPAHQKGVWDNFIFDLSQCNTEVESDMLAAINAPLIVEEGDSTAYGILNYRLDTKDAKTISTGTWYTAIMDVNVETRVVEYSVMDVFDDELTSGTMTVPENDVNGEPISMFAQGIYALLARYQSSFLFDEIKISCEVENPYANPPTIALTRLGQDANDEENLNFRAYSISFLDGEELHIKGTDGESIDVTWAECDGTYVYETTQSGVLEAWTTCEGATSDIVKENVDCSPCKLPAVIANISAVEEGYGKTYTLSISNANVPLRPTIFIDYEFTGVNGEKLSGTDVASGFNVTVTEEGTLKLISKAFGYKTTESVVDNNLEYKTKKTWDFARMTEDEYTAAGFTTFEELNTAEYGGFNNWTARKRLYYYDLNTAHPAVDEEGNETGETAYDTVLPFGFVSEDSDNVIEYCVITDNTDNTKYFDGLEIFPTDRNVGYIKHIGIYNDETANNYNPITIKGIDPTDFIVVNTINDYGSNSCHPIVASTEEYYKELAGQNVVLSPTTLPSEGNNRRGENTAAFNEETGKYDVNYCLYRIDTVCTTITIYSQVGGDDAVEAIESVTTGDDKWYSIDGLRVAEPTRPGIYIHNGKKIIVK